MTADLFAGIGIMALGVMAGCWTFLEARSATPDPRYSSRALRVVFWCFSLALVVIGLSLWLGKAALAIGVVLLFAGALWYFLLLASTLFAPRWAARVWFQAFSAASTNLPDVHAPSLAEAEREARKLGLTLVGVLVLVLVGYYLATRWLGIFLLPLALTLLLVVASVRVFRPRRRPPPPGRSIQNA